MAVPANADDSGTVEGSHLVNEKGSTATESICTWQEKLRGSTNKYVGYVESVEAATTVIRQYELETTAKFSCFKSDRIFGAGGKICIRAKEVINNNKINNNIK